jgi:thioesterase domain-containing protein
LSLSRLVCEIWIRAFCWAASRSVRAILAGVALVTIQPGSGSGRPLFCVHAEAGDVSLYYALAGHLGSERRVLGLCASPADELAEHERLEQMAACHVRDIRAAQADGPYAIVGECTGGALAYEIAQQLRAAGEEIALLALIDAWAPGLPRRARWMPKPLYRIVHRLRILAFHGENLIRLGMREKLLYAASKAQRAGRVLVGKMAAILRRSATGVSLQVVFREALAGYDPAPCGGSIVVLRAAALPLGSQAPSDLGWGGLVERVEVETIPGYFTTPISEPGARILAERLTRHLVS